MKIGDLVKRKEYLDEDREKYKFGPVDAKCVGIIVAVNMNEHAKYETYVVNFPDLNKTHVFTGTHLELVSEA
tara:strand:- start:107 stop:322 length:216 start_codon:yes stop_codon:yes gene_type:complete